SGKRRRIGGDDCSRRHVQCGLTENFDIALPSVRKLDDLLGDHFISEVARALNSRTSRFEGDAHETDGLRIEVLAAYERSNGHEGVCPNATKLASFTFKRCETKKPIKSYRAGNTIDVLVFRNQHATRRGTPALAGSTYAEEMPR